MATSYRMISLPGFMLCLVLLRTCLSDDGNSPTDSSAEGILHCPGSCVEEQACVTALNESDCENGLVCCVDHLEEMTTQFADWDFTTENSAEVHYTSEEEVFVEDEGSDVEAYTQYAEPDGNDQAYTLLYSKESDSTQMDSVEGRAVDALEENCPGTCVPSEYTDSCDYVTSSYDMCSEGFTCCLMESDMHQSSHRYSFEVEDGIHSVEKRESVSPNAESCPGTCVHPSHAMFCEEILPQFSCSLNAKCCIKRSIDRVMSEPSVMECTGQCLPLSMQGYCFPPSELILGPTTCTRGTTCCMRRSSKASVRPPSVNRMQIPGFPLKGPDSSRVVLGHLGIDNGGNVFKVSTNGQISDIPQLPLHDHTRAKYTKLTGYTRVDGDVAIFSDSTGNLYQQFYPRYNPLLHLQPSKPPVTRQQANQFESQHTTNFQKTVESQESVSSDNIDDALEDIVLPDDEDEVVVPTTSTPVVHDENSSRPQCPGSCMSYFLRFTCFRGYAIYDGFTCPGRSVCCARLKDIEEHEQYLKSLSPYFNASPASRDHTVPRCGIKGRRDAPRVIGGKESLPGEWCWQVAIINVQNQYICGGALIADMWVLTAAHCVVGPMNENQALFVRLGVTDLRSTEDNIKGQTIRVLSTYVHHNFKSVNLDNNIALLRLHKSAKLGSNVCFICLPTSGQMPKEDTKCAVTGYGFVSKDGDMSLKIREAVVPVIDDTDCMTNVSEALTNPFILPSSSFCAGGHGQEDACQGDAGGPLACEVGGYHELVGLVSWGLGCGRSDVPSIYIKVPAFMGWINQIIGSNSYFLSLV